MSSISTDYPFERNLTRIVAVVIPAENNLIPLLKIGLYGIAILVLDTFYRKNCDITILCGFYKTLWIDCSIRVFRSFC